ncbi:PREDICTED: histone-lysine N-methyltransferase setd3 [Tarenaya hassleriana]|uniref:histone-lysine N-methyltransferase setd3 n=1 Tax=Tarenaya hassleriana TaxID=28532 RepID=UPI00053C1543|nr:PREDICTED: histone-lysine N-methyltransferase setd3 [Tarenaya hassleriana]
MAASKMALASLALHIRPLTCMAASQPSRLAPHPPDLILWVKREGGFVHHSLKLSDDGSSGLGLVSSEKIPQGSDLISLPPHVPLRFESESDDDAASFAVLADLARRIPDELWAMKLGMRLLQERAKIDSFWWPYISNLPETYTVPIFFPGEDIKNLQYAPLLYQVNRRCRFLLEFEQEIRRTLEGIKPSDHPFRGQDVDASSLGWAMSAVSSRAFRLHGKKLLDGSSNDVPMMLPLIDMCNHSFKPNARIIQEQSEENTNTLVKVIAETDIKENDPLMLNYGCLGNDFFLLDYGFVIESNPYDTVELKYDEALMDAASMAAGVSSPNFSSPSPWQSQFLSRLNLAGEASNLKVAIGGPELVEGRLLAALRILLCCEMEAVEKHDINKLKSLSVEAPLGIANELAVFRTVIALCMIALGHFPTKIMEDEAVLKQGVSATTELAARYRIQKKSVIIDVMRDLSRRVKSLSSKETSQAAS